MNPQLTELLRRTDEVMAGRQNGNRAPVSWGAPRRRWQVGVDLGTAYTVLVVLDEAGQPVAGAYEFAQVVRDGLVVDFVGAVELLRRLKQQVEAQLGGARGWRRLATQMSC